MGRGAERGHRPTWVSERFSWHPRTLRVAKNGFWKETSRDEVVDARDGVELDRVPARSHLLALSQFRAGFLECSPKVADSW